MKDELFIKEINGNKVYCLEYDKETLKDMVIEKQEEIEELKSIIDKAKEYIEDSLYVNKETGEYCLSHTFDSSNLYELLNILRGEDNGI